MRLFVLWIITASAVLSYINYTRQVKALEEQSEAYVGFAARQCAVALAFSSDDDLKVTAAAIAGVKLSSRGIQFFALHLITKASRPSLHGQRGRACLLGKRSQPFSTNT